MQGNGCCGEPTASLRPAPPAAGKGENRGDNIGAPGRDRTADSLFTKEMLYQLSYRGERLYQM